MKINSFVSFFKVLFLLFSLSLFSCKNIKIHPKDKFLKAMELYNKKKYSDAAKLFQEVIISMSGKYEAIEASWLLSNCYFNSSNYRKAIKEFIKFYEVYPKNEKAEEALYLSIVCLNNLSARVYLDQKETFEAIEFSEEYIDSFPQGKFFDKVVRIKNNLKEKIDIKNISTVKVFFNLKYYNATLSLIEDIINEINLEFSIDELVKTATDTIIKIAKKNKKKSSSKQIQKYLKFLYRCRAEKKINDTMFSELLRTFFRDIEKK